METAPTCPENYILRKTKCKCVPKKKSTKKKIKLVLKEKTPPKPIKVEKLPSPKSSSKTRKKRCPKGTYRNKKTGNCETKKQEIKKEKTIEKLDPQKVITIPNQTPSMATIVGNAVNSVLKRDPAATKETNKEFAKTIKKELVREKSFSPEVNKMLQTMKTATPRHIFGCDANIKDIFTNTIPKVNVGTLDKPKCVSYKSKEAQKYMLHNLNSIKTLNCKQIIAPKQFQSNCWFNTFFMTFFVSDKGRKFFRQFRQLMIEGKHADGTKIKSTKMHKALFLLNMAIEASYNMNDKTSTLALTMDTNAIIKNIFDSIPMKEKLMFHGIRPVGRSGNPIDYYLALTRFLNYNAIQIKSIEISTSIYIDQLERKLDAANSDPVEVMIINIFDPWTDKFNKQKYGADTIKNKQETYDLTFKNNQKATYRLDAAVLRDIKQKHFCSLLMCDGEQYGFDGISYRRLAPFQWKPLLNKNHDWSFQGSANLYWNFLKSYQMLFYYRVK